MDCETAETPPQFDEALRFRASIYREVGRLGMGEHPDNTPLAEKSLTLLFRHGTRLVATVDLGFPTASTALDSVDRAIGYYPESFPAKIDTIEVARLCIRREYRGTDLSKAIFQQIHRHLVLTGRTHIITSAAAALLPKYDLIGFKRTGLSYSRRYGKSERLEILVTRQMRWGVYGLHVGPIRWNLFLRDISDRLQKEGVFRPGIKARAVYWGYRCFAPFAEWVERRTLERRRAERYK